MSEENTKASTFAYERTWQVSRATTTVHTDTPTAQVTYRGEGGARFRVLFRQKPNPVGFHARLPGDAAR